jgi:hypothetical protein
MSSFVRLGFSSDQEKPPVLALWGVMGEKPVTATLTFLLSVGVFCQNFMIWCESCFLV